MGNEIRVNVKAMKQNAASIQETAAYINKTIADLDSVVDYLYSQGDSYSIIVNSLRKVQGVTVEKSRVIKAFGSAITTAADQYRTTENLICLNEVIKRINKIIDGYKNWLSGKKENKEYHVDSIVFDDKGKYGGDQGNAMNESEARKQELFDLIRKNNPDINLSDEQLNNFLKKMNSEGCGYVALINTIFAAYEGREEEFEKTFGYPMYYKGDLNYDMLLADLYSTMDNRDVNGNYDKYNDYDFWENDGFSIFYDPWKDTSGHGTTPGEGEAYLESFMRSHGDSVDVTTDVNVTPSNFRQISEGGKQVIMYYYSGDLLNMDGSVAQTINGGHAMVVTGVTEDGRFIVSSWGDQYIIDPRGSTPDTYMTFSTVEY